MSIHHPSISPGPSAPTPPPPALALAKRPQLGPLTATQDKALPKNAPRNIPAFLTKLYTMVNDPATDHLIRWTEPSGDSFFVVSSERFGRELLPKYFKHSNFGSFVRQLNMYGFHKVPHLNQGVLQGEVPETEMLEFTNPHFQRGQPDMLCLIQRKKTAPEANSSAAQPESAEASTPHHPSSHSSLDFASVLTDIAAIRKHQALLSADLKNLQSSNAHLWQEAIASRDRNKRCQETISKILGFLAQVFGGRVLSGHSPSSRPTPAPQCSPSDLDTDVRLNEDDEDDADMIVGEGPMAEGVGQDPKLDSTQDAGELRYQSTSTSTATSAPLYHLPRLPRLMLEDVQRGEPTGSEASTSEMANTRHHDPTRPHYSLRPHTNFDPRTARQVDDRSRRTASPKTLRDKDFSNLFAKSFTTLAPSPRKTSTSSTSRFRSIADSPPETVIDPNLIGGDRPPAPAPDSPPATDAYSPDNVLQALFNENNSNPTFGSSEGIFSSLNWAELLSNNEASLLETGSSQPSSMFPPPSSPLRITDGMPPASLAGQADAIGAIDEKVESLEAAIDRLVGSLPNTVVDNHQFELANTEPLPDTNTDQPAPRQPDENAFDPDAFIKYFLTSSDKPGLSIPSPTTTPSVAQTPKATPPALFEPLPPGSAISEPTLAPTIPLDQPTSTSLMESTLSSLSQPTSVSLPQPTSMAVNSLTAPELDFDRILDEWTCPDPTSNTVSTPDLTVTEPFVFDFDDVEQLKRIMAKKAGGGGGTGEKRLGVEDERQAKSKKLRL
ncbi:hypothetical protein CROQUDRAFT_656621 [Cronartium quercuum f. sp. fusiforme G11]|uniref:HSF-type DNA-binding domain-containing protein n=1 Tax=Cronartium quercuum f. sp. fusiforme G11 TaxID=708437 RepID=A0A9P6NJ77_9BASI|nr:hypothetical protein CROQUDRAFT_656621 [Cronartium quercuum f. sp. fusiforme G11]